MLRGVDERYFPRITYVNTMKRGNQYVLFYVAEGKGFKVGVCCGTDGVIHKVTIVSSKGRHIKPTDVPNPDSLREYIDRIGFLLKNGRRR